MENTRGTRILGMTMIFGVSTAYCLGSWEHTGVVTMVAIIIGGFVGEAWHRWRQDNA